MLSENQRDRLSPLKDARSSGARPAACWELLGLSMPPLAFVPLLLPRRALNPGDGGMWLSAALGLRSQVQREWVCFWASGCSDRL